MILSLEFLAQYYAKEVQWSPISSVVYARTYSRLQEDGNSETWVDTCRRVTEGTFEVLKSHIHTVGSEWNQQRATRKAEEFFRRLYDLRWSPPGRGLWMMGTDYVRKNGSLALNNCAAISTQNIDTNFSEPFVTLMDFSMLGTGVGFDVRGAGKVTIKQPFMSPATYIVEDSRTGWTDLIRHVLDAYVGKSYWPSSIDFGKIREAGTPIRGFGGTSSGPTPLKQLVLDIQGILNPLIGKVITSTAIVDIFNYIGKCVVSGNVRRSAELALGFSNDKAFMDLKLDMEALKDRRWASNNSLVADDITNWKSVTERIEINGEPGLVFLNNFRNYGRLIDPSNFKDQKIMGVNPCVTGDTIVYTAQHGYEPILKTIERFENGEFLEIKTKSGFRKISSVHRNGFKSLTVVMVSNGNYIKCTDQHKIFANGKWIEAYKLKRGMVLKTFNGLGPATVREIWKLDIDQEEEEVYDLTVDGEHNYFANGILVHNCSEIGLEDGELCNVPENYPTRHASLNDFLTTLKYSYLYGKVVSLIPCHNTKTQSIVERNRRLGISVTGIIELYSRLGMREMKRWLDTGYKYLQCLDQDYSEWLKVPTSIKLTSVKPSGSVSILAGCEGGMKVPTSEYYYRTIRMNKDSELVSQLREAGFRCEDDVYTPNSTVVYFPSHTKSSVYASQISLWEQMAILSALNHYWADNSVSATLTFRKEEAKDIARVLDVYQGKLKSVSFLPYSDHSYEQAPYIPITKEEYEKTVKPFTLKTNNAHEFEAEDKFCSGDKCTI